jgi:hypothetical protein
LQRRRSFSSVIQTRFLLEVVRNDARPIKKIFGALGWCPISDSLPNPSLIAEPEKTAYIFCISFGGICGEEDFRGQLKLGILHVERKDMVDNYGKIYLRYVKK